ncbi:glyceraldehyde-3-phosphate dehydrogenase [Sediminivirga luteola]|uniref:glyceraldehyde-3-phosphate dehydrogenase n=1 Tax=Sediminivirga luteola TaxID=1774748 RepID=UPI001F59B685|nr:glyceraldehyde-3-phosphate dehydrogenase [Sediminivirga luteola]
MSDVTTSMEEWNSREAVAEALVPVVGRLHRQNHVLFTVYGRSLLNKSVRGILKAHRYARHFREGRDLEPARSLELAEAVAALNPGTASIDLGRLSDAHEASGMSLEAFLAEELAQIAGQGGVQEDAPQDVVLYGFGRIGRLVARILIDHAGGGSRLRLRAVVVRKGSENDLIKRASLLRRDSVHGKFDGTITVDEEAGTITANGVRIQFIYSSSPAEVDYTTYGINDAIVVDNTGRWRDREGLGQHLLSRGVSRVLLTAPGKGDIPNIVYGINHEQIGEDTIVSAASCTTNAITPVLKVLNDRFGVRNGHVETVHSYTNDQNLIDNFHKGSRRGRAAGLNMVLTETGAAKAVAKALPELSGKLSGNAIRVPTPDVSMAILNLNLDTATSKDELNGFLRQTSMDSPLRNQIDYIASPEVVSTDFIGSKRAGVVDGLATIVNDDRAVVYVWYDNEFGYSCQVVRVVEQMAGVHAPKFPRV